MPNSINILKNIKLGTVPESVIILREQVLCWSSGGEAIVVHPPRIDNQQFCQSTPDLHFVDPQGGCISQIAIIFSAGMRSMQPHYLHAKYGVATSLIKELMTGFP